MWPLLVLLVLGDALDSSIPLQQMNCGLGFTCSELSAVPPVCVDGTPHEVADAMPAGLTIAFMGDQGVTADAEAVLQLMMDEGADMILHAGDVGYGYGTTADWKAQLDAYLPSTLPYMTSIGNHDNDWDWTLADTRAAIYERLVGGMDTCEGLVGVNTVCTISGVTILLLAPGESGLGGNHVEFIDYAFNKYPSKWRVCVWHKNMRVMQAGDKSDEAGWGVYQECLKYGAMIHTGHQHHYSRTFGMSSFKDLEVISFDPSAPLVLKEGSADGSIKGKSFAFVSGVGGHGIRTFNGGLELNPHWAVALSSETDLDHGALFCNFNVDGDENKASCYFKDIRGRTLDSFTLKNEVALGDDSLTRPDTDSVVMIQIQDNNDNAEQYLTSLTPDCTSSDIEIGTAESGAQLSAWRFQNVPIEVEDIDRLYDSYIDFTVDERALGALDASLTGELSTSSASVCDNGDLLARTETSSSVAWSESGGWDAVLDRERSPNLTPIVTEIVQQSGWTAGNPITFFARGSGARHSEAYTTNACLAAVLVLRIAEPGSCMSPPEAVDGGDVPACTIPAAPDSTCALTCGGSPSGDYVCNAGVWSEPSCGGTSSTTTGTTGATASGSTAGPTGTGPTGTGPTATGETATGETATGATATGTTGTSGTTTTGTTSSGGSGGTSSSSSTSGTGSGSGSGTDGTEGQVAASASLPHAIVAIILLPFLLL